MKPGFLPAAPPLTTILTEKQQQELAERIFLLMEQGSCGFGEVRLVVQGGHLRFIKLEISESFVKELI